MSKKGESLLSVVKYHLKKNKPVMIVFDDEVKIAKKTVVLKPPFHPSYKQILGENKVEKVKQVEAKMVEFEYSDPAYLIEEYYCLDAAHGVYRQYSPFYSYHGYIVEAAKFEIEAEGMSEEIDGSDYTLAINEKVESAKSKAKKIKLDIIHVSEK